MRFEPGEHEDLYGHGTACAAVIRGLAPDVELVSVRVLGDNLKGSARAFAHGLRWCLDHDVTVASLSLSTTNVRHAEMFYELVDAATFRGMLLVSAMSNERKRTIPSEFAGVFSVACGPGTDRERFWYNPAAPAEWGAPGVDVEVAWNGHTTIIGTGNSFAAPVIAGHLARHQVRPSGADPLANTHRARGTGGQRPRPDELGDSFACVYESRPNATLPSTRSGRGRRTVTVRGWTFPPKRNDGSMPIRSPG